jgi:hypothetical protein
VNSGKSAELTGLIHSRKCICKKYLFYETICPQESPFSQIRSEGVLEIPLHSEVLWGPHIMRKEKKLTNSFPLRLSVTMRRQLESLAKEEGISINQFICLAMAEKITRLDLNRHAERPPRTANHKPLVNQEFAEKFDDKFESAILHRKVVHQG